MRLPCVAGVFYQEDSEGLGRQLRQCFLSSFGPGELPGNGSGKIKGVIVPHAGFSYSGPCAASAYKIIAESEKQDLFVVFGPSHSGFNSCISMEDWKTPLGVARVDKKFAELLAEMGIPQDEQAHAEEHSIEVQLPFMQFVFRDFLFVPVMVSEDYEHVASAVMKAVRQSGKNVVFIASSDFTHYGAAYGYVPFAENVKERMHALDAGAIDRILQCDTAGFLEYVSKTGATICGRYSIAALLECIKKSSPELLKYYTSADIADSGYSAAVGYATMVFR